MLIVAILIRLQLGSPVLFRHVRPGRDAKPFTILKFRPMFPARPGTEHIDTDSGARPTVFPRRSRRWSAATICISPGPPSE
jgi:lipopolysaccharide/colanic/teichoic acid biosynthesis glycosyltransferase